MTGYCDSKLVDVGHTCLCDRPERHEWNLTAWHRCCGCGHEWKDSTS